MRLKLYCNRFGHFKDALVCSVNCAYRTRCQDFALFYDEHREGVEALVADYYAERQQQQASPAAATLHQQRTTFLPVVPATLATAVDLRELISLEVKREMAEVAYIWIDKEGRAELMEQEEVLRRAARGIKPQTIYKVAQEMELRFQLVPRKRIEKAKRTAAVEAERAAARRHSRQAGTAKNVTPMPIAAAFDEDENFTPAVTTPRRTRRRLAKAVNE
ncbi:MAG: hypothetical protein H0T45_06425 [Pyrinomonadaceae bacterium]|nr:hypothetical protein [Pyrinomonadaceae bacterium]